jgi:transposase
VVFGLEPTANYHKPLREHLIKCGRMVVLVSGVAVKHNRELLDGRWEKHDTKDSANIADPISQGIGCEMGEGAHFETQVMVDGLRQLRETIKTTDERIRETCRQFPEYGYLLPIPGFGPDVSAKVIGALGNPFRFQNRKQVLKMAGLDLGANRSGKTAEAATPVIYKKGKADLRYLIGAL